MSATTIIVLSVALAGAWYWDARSWRRKPREDLVRMLESGDCFFHKTAISELRRRGEDVTPYLPRIVASLVAHSKVDRAAAQITIKDCFPELAAEIAGYSPTADLETCRAKAMPLLSRFPLQP